VPVAAAWATPGHKNSPTLNTASAQSRTALLGLVDNSIPLPPPVIGGDENLGENSPLFRYGLQAGSPCLLPAFLAIAGSLVSCDDLQTSLG
jgi:hypothetical protein